MYENIEKVKVIVFVENQQDIVKYAKLLYFLMGDRIENAKKTKNDCWLYGKDFVIHFMRIGQMSRGHRAHYVINLVQDVELNNVVARPIERFDQLRYDPKFAWLT